MKWLLFYLGQLNLAGLAVYAFAIVGVLFTLTKLIEFTIRHAVPAICS